MLESLISAYVLSALSLEGARSSERQMIASSWLLMIASLAFSYATPVDQMHPRRPLRSLFHPAIFLSMVGQAVIHLYTMREAVMMATDAMGRVKTDWVALLFLGQNEPRSQKEVADAPTKAQKEELGKLATLWKEAYDEAGIGPSALLVHTPRRESQ